MKLNGTAHAFNEAFTALVESGYQVVASDFDESAFKMWRKRVIDCIASLLGVDHPYVYSFSECVLRQDSNSLFLGRGLIDATRREVLRNMNQ